MVNRYSDKLQDSRWISKRDRILIRDNQTCRGCRQVGLYLQVHHTMYLEGKEPWDYPDSILVSLCSSCHKMETNYYQIHGFDNFGILHFTTDEFMREFNKKRGRY
jgi:5-methylcytosine-specific restriction endonuclease McrA